MSLSSKLSILDVPVKGKRVLVRVDFNVPIKDGTVADATRITAALPTLSHLQREGAAKVIVMSHLGRPDGVANKEMSLRPVALSLERILGEPVLFLDDCVGPSVEEACRTAPCRFVMLENLRFHVEEEGRCKRKDGSVLAATPEQTEVFCKSLSSLGDVYINDAFGTMHRAHSSIAGIQIAVRAAGFLVQKELDFFSRILDSPEKLDLLILGGAKVSDKILLIENMLPKTRRIMIGGGMAFTFLAKLKNFRIGKSLYDSKGADMIPSIMEKAERLGVDIMLPVDAIASMEFAEKSPHKVVDMREGIDADWLGLDIGPKTQESFSRVIDAIRGAKRTILWNGPMGVFEWDAFAAGTKVILDALVRATETAGTTTVIGGGDSAAAAAKWGCEAKVSHVSTGGGASLELLEGK